MPNLSEGKFVGGPVQIHWGAGGKGQRTEPGQMALKNAPNQHLQSRLQFGRCFDRNTAFSENIAAAGNLVWQRCNF